MQYLRGKREIWRFESVRPALKKASTKQKLQYPVRILEFLVGAGGLREPRRIRNPGRGSQRLRRALGSTRILLAAAPTAPPCFCRWQRSSLLHRGFFPRRTIRRVDAVRIHPPSPEKSFYKTETPVPGSDTGVLGGRGWITRAALLKTAHWAVFALSSATAPQLFESTLVGVT